MPGSEIPSPNTFKLPDSNANPCEKGPEYTAKISDIKMN
jgi:hypothetical protein